LYNPRAVEECPECRQLDFHIANLKRGLDIERLELFTTRHSKEEKDRRFELLLQLMNELDVARANYSRHRRTHFQPQG
jgi:hypothetical protein